MQENPSFWTLAYATAAHLLQDGVPLYAASLPAAEMPPFCSNTDPRHHLENVVVEPINALRLCSLPEYTIALLATGQGILRTDHDGSTLQVVIPDIPELQSIVIGEKSKKIYFGTVLDSFIRRANFDGSNILIFRNVSQGINWELSQDYKIANSYANGIFVDEEAGWLY